MEYTIPEEEFWLIHFEDANQENEVFTSEEHARARLEQLIVNWYCHLLGPAERIAKAEAENASLRAQVARLSADISAIE